jgi:diphthamide biosynthesis methyltransferase
LYKFGKTISLPKWKENYKPLSFLEGINENKNIKAHSLILVDPELSFSEALEELEAAGIKEDLVVASNLGIEKAKFYYDKISKLKKLKIEPPFCFVLPSELHFLEEDFLMCIEKR